MEAIVTALIAGGCSLLGAVISSNRTADKIQADMRVELTKTQAATEVKLENLAAEVRKHNNFAERVPVIETQVDRNARDIATLQKYHME